MDTNTGTVQISMLGTFTIRHGGRQVSESVFRDTRSWQLMKYLADNRGRAVNQSELVRVLWTPESFGPDVVGTLRVRLRRLRESLNAVGLGSSRDGLVLYAQERFFFNPDYDVVTDTQQLYELCRQAENHALGRELRLAACQRGLSLCGGPYLEHSAPAPWVEAGRREVQELFAALARVTLELSGQSGSCELVRELAPRALSLIPEDEGLNTQIMTFLMQHGCVAEVVAHYARLSRVTEAKGDPDPPLTAFYMAQER